MMTTFRNSDTRWDESCIVNVKKFHPMKSWKVGDLEIHQKVSGATGAVGVCHFGALAITGAVGVCEFGH